MKTFSLGLLNNVVSVYDKTKTTITGLVNQKTINTKPVLGPPLTKFIDCFTDTLGTFVPGYMFLSPSNRLFVLLSAPGNNATNGILLYNFNSTTGATTYVGRIAFNIATLTVNAVRSIKIDDSNPNNIKIFVGITSSTPTLGGVVMLNKIDVADFVPVGFPTIFTAISNDVKAAYHLVSPVELGGLNAITALNGLSLPCGSLNAAINTKIFAHNGVSATHQMYAFDYAIAPLLASIGTSTVTAANTTGVSTTFTMTGNTLQINDSVVITTNAPTGFTNTTNATIQTIYFVIAANFVSGSTFSLSTTLGGALVQATSAVATTTFVRALGQSSNLFFGKTPNLTALAGTLVTNNSENACVPQHTANAGFDCFFWCTSTTQYLGRYTDLFLQLTGTLNATINVTGLSSTAGLQVGRTVHGTGIPAGATIATIVSATAITLSVAATASATTSLVFGAALLPNLVNANVLGNSIDYIAVNPTAAVFSSECDSSILAANNIFCVTKKFINSVIQSSVGVSSQIWLEAQNHLTDQFSLSTLFSLETRKGWLLASSISIGQRGIVAMHLASDSTFGIATIISPIIQKTNASLISIQSLEQLFDVTGSAVFEYRAGASASDPIFTTATAGWTSLSSSLDYSAMVIPDFIQFRIQFSLSTSPGSSTPSITTPTQISDLLMSTLGKTEISDNWEYSYDESSTAIPTRVGFYLRQAYTASVPKLFYRAYDDANALLINHNTVDNAANFQYSTDGGVTWLPLGTIANSIGTRLRYTYSTPPGVNIHPLIQEV